MMKASKIRLSNQTRSIVLYQLTQLSIYLDNSIEKSFCLTMY